MTAEPQDALPEVLYHYTDAAGLMGILKPSWSKEANESIDGGSALLRASDVRYMNDSTELRFGADLLAQRMREDAKARPDEMGKVFNELAERLSQGLFAAGARHQRAFAACFCAEGDLLSQWRGYAGGVGGYAIGFQAKVLKERVFAILPRQHQVPLTPWSPLLPVRYGPEECVTAIDAYIQELRSGWSMEANSWVIRDSTGLRPHIEWLVGACYRRIAQLKHEAFREEREYRLIFTGDEDTPVAVRARAAGLVPYIELAVNYPGEGVARDDQALAEVVVGPGADQEGQIAAVRDFLKTAGYPKTPVRGSRAPYKG